jgi:hypothetical protein
MRVIDLYDIMPDEQEYKIQDFKTGRILERCSNLYEATDTYMEYEVRGLYAESESIVIGVYA